MSKQNKKLRAFVTIAMLSSVSFILMLFNFPLPWLPGYLEIDFSDVPAFIAAITMGPMAAVLVEIVKNILDWIYSGSPTGFPVGHIANFTTGMLFILPAYMIYKKTQSSKGLFVGVIVGAVTMSIGMAFLNYVAFLPMYGYFLNFQVENVAETVVKGILPFNIVKGVLLVIVISILYKSLKTWISQQQSYYAKK